MRKSTVMWVLLALLGIVPLGIAGLSSYLNSTFESVDYASYSGPRALVQDDEGGRQYRGPASEDIRTLGEDAPIAETRAVIDSVRNNGDLAATIGAINTAVMGWFTWFYRRREKVEDTLKKLQLDMGDLGLMPLSKLIVMAFRSITSPLTFKRLMLRTNTRYSIYGFVHTSILPVGPGRPMQHMDRAGRTTEWLLDEFEDEHGVSGWRLKERSLTGLVRAWADSRAKAVGFMQDDENTAKVNYEDWLEEESWRSDARYTQNPSELVHELHSTEIAIMLFFEKDGSDSSHENVYTLIAGDGEMPETLEQWEDFIMAFRGENAALIKDKILTTIVALHKEVA